MGLSPVEILAVVFAVAVLLKVLIFAIKPSYLIRKARLIIQKKDSVTFMAGHLVIFLVVGYFVLQELAITQIAAVMFLTVILVGMTLRVYPRTLLKVINDIANIGPERAWLPLLIWALIAVVVLYTIFA